MSEEERKKEGWEYLGGGIWFRDRTPKYEKKPLRRVFLGTRFPGDPEEIEEEIKKAERGEIGEKFPKSFYTERYRLKLQKEKYEKMPKEEWEKRMCFWKAFSIYYELEKIYGKAYRKKMGWKDPYRAEWDPGESLRARIISDQFLEASREGCIDISEILRKCLDGLKESAGKDDLEGVMDNVVCIGDEVGDILTPVISLIEDLFLRREKYE